MKAIEDRNKIDEHKRNMRVPFFIPFKASYRRAYLCAYVSARVESPVFNDSETLRPVRLAVQAYLELSE